MDLEEVLSRDLGSEERLLEPGLSVQQQQMRMNLQPISLMADNKEVIDYSIELSQAFKSVRKTQLDLTGSRDTALRQ